MSSKPQYVKGDYGSTIFRTILKEDHSARDISTATTKSLVFRKPGGSVVTKSMSFVSDGTDGQLKYVLATGDIDEAGEWEMQVRVVLNTSDADFRTKIEKFTVAEAIA